MAKTVLIVEDNLLNMKLFSDLLRGAGYDVLQDPTGETAVSLVRQHRPGLVLMDVQLPGLFHERVGLIASRRQQFHADHERAAGERIRHPGFFGPRHRFGRRRAQLLPRPAD